MKRRASVSSGNKGKRAPTGKKMTLDEFQSQYGKGYNRLEEFLLEWKLHREWADEPSPDDVERLNDRIDQIATAIRDYMEHKFESLDDAFQVRRPNGYRRPAARKQHLHMKQLQDLGLKLRRRGAVTDGAFFEFLGSMFNVGKTTASTWYYMKHRGARPDPSLDPSDIADWARKQLNWKG